MLWEILLLDFFAVGDCGTGLFCFGRFHCWTFLLWEIPLLDFFTVGYSDAGLSSQWANEQASRQLQNARSILNILHCKPIPCNKNRVSPVKFSHREIPVMKTGVPAMRTGVSCNGNRFFPVLKTSQGKPCSGPVLALYRIAVYEIAVYQCHIFVIGAWSFVFNCSIEIAIFYNANDYGACQQVFPAISREKGCNNHRENLYSSKGKIVYVEGKPCNIYRLQAKILMITIGFLCNL